MTLRLRLSRGAPSAAREPFGRELRRGLRRAHARGRRVLRRASAGGHRRARRAASRARATPGCLVEAVLPLRRRATGSRAIRRSRRRRPSAQRGRNAELAAPPQPRRHLDARQVGVPVVRRVGPGVPHDPVRAGRSGLRQAAAPAVPARVVHAPERAAPGLRVRVRRREPAGARLGVLARLQDRRRRAASATARSSRASSRSCCSTSPGG